MSLSATQTTLRSSSFQLSFWSFFFLWISFDFFILFPLYILKKGGDSVDVGIQQAVFFFPSVLVRPVAGWFTDRIGRVKTLWAGSVFMALTALSFLFLRGQYFQIKWWIALILVLRGTGFAALYTAFFTYAADHTLPENRSRVMGLFGISGLVAHGLAPWLGQKVLGAHDFDGFFLVSGLLSIVSLLISLFLTEKRLFSPPRETGFSMLRSVTFTRRNLMILPAASVFGYMLASFNTFGAAYFKFVGKAQTGNFFLAYGFSAGLVRIFFGGLADRYPRWILIAIFFLLQSIGISLIVVSPVERYYLITAICCGSAHGILFPTLTAMAIDAHPLEFRGMVTSVFTGTIELGFCLGSYIQGVLISVTSYGFMFLSTAVVGVVLSGYVLGLRSIQRREI